MKKNFIWGLIGLLIVAAGVIGALIALGKFKKNDDDFDCDYDLEAGDVYEEEFFTSESDGKTVSDGE